MTAVLDHSMPKYDRHNHVTSPSLVVCLVSVVNTYVVLIRVLFMHVSSYILNNVHMLCAYAALFSC